MPIFQIIVKIYNDGGTIKLVWNLGKMFTTTDNFTINTKRNFGKIKSFLGLIASLCFLFSLAYFIYYGLVFGTNDEILLGYTQNIFKPIAEFFHPEGNGLTIYFDTAVSLLKLLIPCFVLYLICEFFQSIILAIHDKLVDIKNKNIKKQEREKYLQQFESIKYFSIAVSFDYKKNGTIPPPKAINQLNKIVNEKLEASLSGNKARIDISGIFSITSSNFNGYDVLYENLLKTVAKIRQIINKKYQIETIPTITTDAYMELPSESKVVGAHYAIKGCNLKNKAVNTNIFYKKYNYLGFEKFAGVSIGIYNNNQTSNLEFDAEYDLNIVIKNLSDKLDRL